MLEIFAPGFQQVLAAEVLFAVLIAVPVGLLAGILPGLGGIAALALLLPFVYGMEPMAGLAFLVAAHAVIYTGGSLSAVLLGIPGAPPNAATVADGYSMSQRGYAGVALGAALTASGVGGLIGFAVLVALLPFVQTIVMSFGSPETFLLSLLGITYIAILGRGAMVKGLIAGGLGIFLALFGYQKISGVPRFWFELDYLLDGFRLVPLVLGLFAIPEVLSLSGRRTASRDQAQPSFAWTQILAGAHAVIQHRWLCLRSSLIGVVVGIVPGIGGETAPFVAYAAARQASARPDEFGTGVIEGVIAPESSNNAKEGGALVTTLALGIPGSAGMAVLLGGFLLVGLEPGPGFLTEHMDIAVGLAIVLALANAMAVLLMLGLSKWLVRIANVDGDVLAPLLLVLVVTGAYATDNNPVDVLMVFVFGALGWVLREFDYSRAALLLGFVLAASIETYLHISLQAYGAWFFLRPASLVILGIMLFGLCWPLLRSLISKSRTGLR